MSLNALDSQTLHHPISLYKTEDFHIAKKAKGVALDICVILHGDLCIWDIYSKQGWPYSVLLNQGLVVSIYSRKG